MGPGSASTGTITILRSPLPGEALLFFPPMEPESAATDSGCLGLRLSAVMNVGRWGGGGVELSGWGDGMVGLLGWAGGGEGCDSCDVGGSSCGVSWVCSGAMAGVATRGAELESGLDAMF